MLIARNAVFVDAGYVFAQGSVSVIGTKLARQQVELNTAEIINQLKAIAASGGMPLLRIYWYDGTRGPMTVEQSTLADMPDVKVRLGYINSAGEQKGVDSLLVTDLIDLARNAAIADAYIVSSDGDMRIAVQIAQGFGVRIHLITLEPSGVSLNPQLKQEVDTHHEISRIEVAKFIQQRSMLSSVVSINAPAKPGATLVSVAKQAIKTVMSTIGAGELQQLRDVVGTGKNIPPTYDRKVLGTCRALLNRDLDDEERRRMRDLFLEWLKQPVS